MRQYQLLMINRTERSSLIHISQKITSTNINKDILGLCSRDAKSFPSLEITFSTWSEREAPRKRKLGENKNLTAEKLINKVKCFSHLIVVFTN